MNKAIKNFKKLIHKEIGILIAGLIIVGGILMFSLIADEVSENETQNFDEYVLKSLRTGDNYKETIGPYWVKVAMRDITALGGGTVLSIITIVIVIFLILKKEYRVMWFMIFAIAGGALLNNLLKEIFGRQRPEIVQHLVQVESLSFPSGHSTMSAVMYLTLAAILSRVEPEKKVRIYTILVALILTFLIGFSRVFLGVHYPTDVLAGWCLGLSWATLCWFGAKFIQNKFTGSRSD